MGVYAKGQSIQHVHSSRASVSWKSPTAALKISRAMKRGSRRAAIAEAWAMVGELKRAA
jgi:hypothetical protein